MYKQTIGDLYYEQPRTKSKCSVCGDTKEYKTTKRSKKGNYFSKRWYYRVFEKVNWFRGDDEYLGIICKSCLEEGKIREVNKLDMNELDTLEAQQAQQAWELSKVPTQALKDELARREEGSHYECDLDVTDPDHWYCAEHDVEGSY